MPSPACSSELLGLFERLLQDRPGRLLPDCKRVREGNISPHAGAYCQARLHMPIVSSQTSVRSYFGATGG